MAQPAAPAPAMPDRRQASVALSVLLGAGMGIMPATSEMVPILFVALSLICLWVFPGGRLWDHWRDILPLMIYLSVHLGFNLYHGSFAQGDGYAQGYVVQIILSLLLLRLFTLPQIDTHILVYSTAIFSFGSIALVYSEYYEGVYILDTYYPQCRAGAFSGNAQWVSAFLILTVAAVLIYWHKHNLRHGVLAYGLVVMTLISLGEFSGARMAFYTFLTFLLIYPAYLLLTKCYKAALKTWAAAGLGTALTFLIAFQSVCDFETRVLSQFQFVPKIVQFFTHSDANLDQSLGRPSAGQGQAAQPLPIILMGLRMVQDRASAPPPPADLHRVQDQAALVDANDALALVHAGGSRVQLWKNAWAAIVQAPLAGYGQAQEAGLVQNGYVFFAKLTHFHNQYLSWVIWSGVLGVVVGVYFLASMVLRGVQRSLAWTFFGMLALLCATETFLFTYNMNMLIVTYLFYLQLARGGPQAG